MKQFFTIQSCIVHTVAAKIYSYAYVLFWYERYVFNLSVDKIVFYDYHGEQNHAPITLYNWYFSKN